eukprot:14336606-Alexandrium_andersonii.AAC.1
MAFVGAPQRPKRPEHPEHPSDLRSDLRFDLPSIRAPVRHSARSAISGEVRSAAAQSRLRTCSPKTEPLVRSEQRSTA